MASAWGSAARSAPGRGLAAAYLTVAAVAAYLTVAVCRAAGARAADWAVRVVTEVEVG